MYADSRFRLPLPKRDDLDEVGKKQYDRAAGPISSNNLVGLQGPGGVRYAQSRRGRTLTRLQRLSAVQRGTQRECPGIKAILVTAREMDNQFEWSAHEPEGLKQGLSSATIDAIKYRKSVAGLPAQDAAIIQLGREVFGHHKVSSATFAQALAVYGPRDLVTIVSLMGHYSETGFLLETFDVRSCPLDRNRSLPMR